MLNRAFLLPVAVGWKKRLLIYFAILIFTYFCLLLAIDITPTTLLSDINQTVVKETRRPAFVASHSITPTTMCLNLVQGAIWEPGDRAAELSLHILQHTEFRVNGRYVNFNRSVFQILTLTAGFDRSGQIAGDYGGLMTFCFEIKSLPAGDYNGSIRTLSRSGVEHLFSWNFFVER